MGFTVQKMNEMNFIVHANTVGGATYESLIDGRTYCCRPLSPRTKDGIGAFCTRAAGHGTPHTGIGACKFHSGTAGRPQISTNPVSIKVTARMQLKKRWALYKPMQEYSDVDELLRLRNLQEDILDNLLQNAHDNEDEDADFDNIINKLVGITKEIASMTVKIIQARNEDNHIMTVSTMKFIMARALDIARRYMPEQAFILFYEEWKKDVLLGAPSGDADTNLLIDLRKMEDDADE